jgi:hypothetical protein
VITAPASSPAQEAGWKALFDVHTRMPTGWCLVGGQMVHLHCWERGSTPQRPTDDADAVLDVRARPRILHDFTALLKTLDFTSAGTSPSGHQHRWVRDNATIDVLIPRNVGIRASQRTGVSGGTTLETPGAQQALDRAQRIEVTVGDAEGSVLRPDMLGALVAKSAAYSVTVDPSRRRHLIDLAVLTTLLRAEDRIGSRITPRDRYHLINAVGALRSQREIWIGIEGAERGVDRLSRVLSPTAQ